MWVLAFGYLSDIDTHDSAVGGSGLFLSLFSKVDFKYNVRMIMIRVLYMDDWA